ncbi:hypothetical protein NBRC111893_506 [Lentilactobacillus kosonis]|uniref:Uncharacterized protein n=1 Tax=Lentilactobacillus kosonis TaxID=2810561 RepID=A0A401FIZ6_9LACO|nr:hypothetical protein NBRC111893_506 [Lentilactobacillus kosonis]
MIPTVYLGLFFDQAYKYELSSAKAAARPFFNALIVGS